VWTNKALGGAFSNWLEFVAEIVKLKKRVMRNLRYGWVVTCFEAWYDFQQMADQAQRRAVVDATDWLIDEVERADPLEQLRAELAARGVEPAELADRLWHERTIGRYERWAPPAVRPEDEQGRVVVFVASYFSSADVSMSFLQLAITIVYREHVSVLAVCGLTPPGAAGRGGAAARGGGQGQGRPLVQAAREGAAPAPGCVPNPPPPRPCRVVSTRPPAG
jgi:hypothetical protein